MLDLIVGLDIATKTGVSVIAADDGFELYSTIIKSKVKKDATDLDRIKKFKSDLTEVLIKIDTLSVEVGSVKVAYEDVLSTRFLSKRSSFWAFSLYTTMLIVLDDLMSPSYLKGLQHTLVPVKPVQVKKFATGNARAPKEKMVAAYKAQTGKDPLNQDHADAYWVAQWARLNDNG